MDWNFNLMERVIELGYDVEDITPQEEMELKLKLNDMVEAAYNEISRLVQAKLKSTRQDYLKGLGQSHLGDDWLIILDEDSEHWEEGFKAFDMKPGLLRGPNAKLSAKGVMYNIIPIKGDKDGSGGGKTQFRIVTSLSPKNSWIHPGFEGVHAFDAAAEYIDSALDDIIEDVLG